MIPPPTAPRKIIHIDADCFYAAVEIRDDPALKGKPVAVGGSAARRGVIATASYEARRYGVRSAMASATAIKRCPQLILIPGRMSVYREASKQMQAIFADYTELIEPLSLDEAFLDVSGSELCRGSATLIAREIRQRIAAQIGITVSAGIAPNKFIAKVASDWNKPDGQHTVTPQQVDEFLETLPVKRIWGVGKVTAERLEQQGFRTCGDVRRCDIYRFVQQFGQFGEHIHKLARGIDERAVQPEWRRKSVSVEHTYEQDLPDLDSCRAKLPALLEALLPRLQKLDPDYRIQHCFLKMKFHDFNQTTVERRETIPGYRDYAMLCEEAWQRGRIPVRLLGIGARLVDLTDGSGQMDLFDGQDRDQSSVLQKTSH